MRQFALGEKIVGDIDSHRWNLVEKDAEYETMKEVGEVSLLRGGFVQNALRYSPRRLFFSVVVRSSAQVNDLPVSIRRLLEDQCFNEGLVEIYHEKGGRHTFYLEDEDLDLEEGFDEDEAGDGMNSNL